MRQSSGGEISVVKEWTTVWVRLFHSPVHLEQRDRMMRETFTFSRLFLFLPLCMWHEAGSINSGCCQPECMRCTWNISCQTSERDLGFHEKRVRDWEKEMGRKRRTRSHWLDDPLIRHSSSLCTDCWQLVSLASKLRLTFLPSHDLANSISC